jgi:hypothetical protein
MRQLNEFRRNTVSVSGLLALTMLLVGADGPKQTVAARGLSFQAPASWKSSPPASQMRLAQLKADPLEGDSYPAELVVYAFGGPWFNGRQSRRCRVCSRTRMGILPR